jgi:hypothetical protein
MGLPFIGIIVPVIGEVVFFLLKRVFAATTDIEFLDLHMRTKLIQSPKWHSKSLNSAIKIRSMTKSREKWLQLTANIKIMTFVVLYLAYAAICQSALLVLKTTNLKYTNDDDVLVSERMEADTEIATSSDQYTYLLRPAALIFLLAYGFSIPSILLFNMYKRKKRLFEGDRTTEIYGFMIQGYAYDRYWWEIVVMIRKLLVSVIVVFLANDQNTTYQSFALILVTDVAIVLGIYTKPFRSNIAQAFETLSLSVIHVTLMAGLLLDSDLTDSFSKDAEILKNDIVSWLTLALNIIVILSMIGTLSWDFWKEQNLSDILQGNFIYMKFQAAQERRQGILKPQDFVHHQNIMSLSDFKQRSGGVILFQKNRINRSAGSVSTLSTASSRASSVDIEKGNIRGRSKAIHRVPTIDEEISFDLVLDAPAVSIMTNVYTETRLWGAERLPSVDFKSVPKLDLAGIESDSSVSSAEAQSASRFESEFSLPILRSTITMESAASDSFHRLRHDELLPQATTTNDCVTLVSNSIDTYQLHSSDDESEPTQGSFLEEIELSAFQFESPEAPRLPMPIEALMPSVQLELSSESRKAMPKFSAAQQQQEFVEDE